MKKLTLLLLSFFIYTNSFGQMTEHDFFDILLTLPKKTHSLSYLENGYFVFNPMDKSQKSFLIDTLGNKSELPCNPLRRPSLWDTSGFYNCYQDSILRLYSISKNEFLTPENIESCIVNEKFYALKKDEKACLYNMDHKLLHELKTEKKLCDVYYGKPGEDIVSYRINNKKTTLNYSGEIVPNIRFKMDKNTFSNGVHYFVEDEKHGLKSASGEIIIPAKYKRIREWQNNQYIVSLIIPIPDTTGAMIYPTRTRIGLFNTDSQKMVLPIEYTSIAPYDFGLRCEQPKCKITFLDTDLKNVYNKEFTILNATRDGFIYLEDDFGKYYDIVLDGDGWTLKDDIESYENFTKLFSIAKFKNGNLVLIDKKGETIFDPKTNEEVIYKSLGTNLIEVKLGRKKGVIDYQGNWKIQPEEQISFSYNNYLGGLHVIDYAANSRYIYSSTGKKIAEGLTSGGIFSPTNAYILSKEEKIGRKRTAYKGVIDNDGNILIPFHFTGRIQEFRPLPGYYYIVDDTHFYLVKLKKLSDDERALLENKPRVLEAKSKETIEKEILEIINEALETKQWDGFSKYIANYSIADCKPKNQSLLFRMHQAPSEVVLEVLAQGVDPNIIDNRSSKQTPLHYFKSLDVHKKLIEMGADINYQNANGRTAAYGLIPMHMDILEYHIQKGLDLELVGKSGRSILSRACQNYNNQSCEYLLKKGANVNSQDKYGMTPLFYAVRHRELPNVKILLQYGASKSIKTTADYLLDFERDVTLPKGSTIVDYINLWEKTYYSDPEKDGGYETFFKIRDLILK